MFGPDARTILITIFLITAPVTIFCVFVGRKFIDDYPHHRGVSILAIAAGLNLLVSRNVSSLIPLQHLDTKIVQSFVVSTGSSISVSNLGERPWNHTA